MGAFHTFYIFKPFKERIALIENAFKGDKAANTAMKELRKAEKLFSDALAASGEKYLRRAYMERREKKENTIQYSLMNDRSYADNVQAIIEMSDEDARQNISENNFVSIASDTPSVILENVEGAENLEIIIPFRKLYAAIKQSGVVSEHYHNLGDLAYQLPNYISDPDAIVTLPDGRINLFTTIKTKKGNNGVVSVELNSVKDINNKFEKYNVVVTFFSADDNYLQNTISKAVKVNYQKENLSQVNPQLLKWMGIVNERSSIDIISNFGENVNTKPKIGSDDTQYSLRDSEGRALTPEQAAFFKDSKVRDAKGSLLVLYHGTSEEFYVFDKSKIKIDNLGRGFYLVDNKRIAESYAERRTQERGGKERIVESYINAAMPFNVDNVTSEQAICVFLLYYGGFSHFFTYLNISRRGSRSSRTPSRATKRRIPH